MPDSKWVILGYLIFIGVLVKILKNTIIGRILGTFLYIIAFFFAVIVLFFLMDFII